MNKSIVPIIVAILIGVGVGVGGTMLIQSSFGSSDEVVNSAPGIPRKGGATVSLGEFTVNLQGAYLKATIAIEVVDAKAAEHLTEKMPFLKDRVNSVLANRTIDDIQAGAAQDKLKEDLLVKLNEVGDNKVTNVLFEGFVYQ